MPKQKLRIYGKSELGLWMVFSDSHPRDPESPNACTSWGPFESRSAVTEHLEKIGVWADGKYAVNMSDHPDWFGKGERW